MQHTVVSAIRMRDMCWFASVGNSGGGASWRTVYLCVGQNGRVFALSIVLAAVREGRVKLISPESSCFGGG